MGYEIKVAELQQMSKAAYVSISAWKQTLEDLQQNISGWQAFSGIQGKTSESICNYLQDIHETILTNLIQMLTEYLTKIAVYEQGYLSIDSSSDAHITQDVLEDKMTEFQSKQNEFAELNEGIRSVLEEVSDICWISNPSNGTIEMNFSEIQSQLSRINEKVGTYENEHRSDCDSVKEYLQTIRSFISGQSGKGQVIISTYTADAVKQTSLYQKLEKLKKSSGKYVGKNQEDLQAVSTSTRAKIDEEIEKALEARKAEGIIGLVDGILMAGTTLLGAGAIIATSVVATPLAVLLLGGGAGTGVAVGFTIAAEGADNYRLAESGSLATTAKNPILEDVWQGNRLAYGTWVAIGSVSFMAAGIMMTTPKTSTQVGNLSERANVVGKGADGAEKGVGNPVKVEGRGSTGRVSPNNLNEQMVMHEVQSNPLKGATEVPIKMTDPRWPAAEGWIKMQKVITTSDGSKVTIHFDYNKITGTFDDFKYK